MAATEGTSTTGGFSRRLAACTCCPRHCGVNRHAGETGFCGIGATARIAHTGLHFGEEPPISGRRGSGTIFFIGCNLRCVYCQNWQISQKFRPEADQAPSTGELAAEMLDLQRRGAHNINLVSPSHVIFPAADAVTAARRAGLTIPIVYNSGGYDSVEALRLIRGLVDIYLPDLKYLDHRLGQRYSAADDYADVVPGVLREMYHQVGDLVIDEEGLAVRGVLVRHLVLPGCVDNSRRCLDLLADLSPRIHVSIMSQYSPQYRAHEYPEIARPLTRTEYDAVVRHALELGLENAFIQEMSSRENLLPDFDRDTPFDFA
ncbi:MAG: radical SAM protein [Deltaproteobacteria bacterium]|nr:radical SAM protein [Candidatus Anaeroferrophillacea bacterium]